MTRHTLAALTVALSVAAAVPPAHAAPRPDPTGLVCGYTTVDHPPARLRQTREMDGGPLYLGDAADPTVSYEGSITCTIQVGAATHAGPDAAVVTGPTTRGVAVVAGTFDYVPDENEYTYVCTQVDLTDGTTLYYDNLQEQGESVWSRNPATAECATAVSSSVPEDPCPPVGCVPCVLLAVTHPPDGDLPVWDCPPYHA